MNHQNYVSALNHNCNVTNLKPNEIIILSPRTHIIAIRKGKLGLKDAVPMEIDEMTPPNIQTRLHPNRWHITPAKGAEGKEVKNAKTFKNFQKKNDSVFYPFYVCGFNECISVLISYVMALNAV